ncbi:MAG TPA: hypothetical protein PKY77_16760 [Phycisphaerae bacterium]|nr:hypothetical protein [Phycisphaerae bacterium]HRY69881.1 hypothetical protein [Phycisphaerae bacterium]HSA25392.1 hypothetical protein [Phycisphaerae bacterium]
MINDRTPFWWRVRLHLAADLKKAGILVLLCVIMIIAGACLVWNRKAPSPATATTMATLASPAAPTHVAAAPQPASRTGSNRPWVREIRRDPFTLPVAAPPHLAKTVRSNQVAADTPDRDPPVRRAAAALVLQNTVPGPRPSATINGQVVRQGDIVDDFVVERIEPARVTVRRETVRVTLELRQ